MNNNDRVHILFVEDDETLGFVTRDNLEQHGYKVTHFINGEEAEKQIANLDFDLAVLDVMLPGVDGFSLAKKIRDNNASVPILFLTARSMKEDRLRGFKLGADDYISKPFSIEELLLRINVFVKRRRIGTNPSDHPLRFGHFVFDPNNLILQSPNKKKLLTLREVALLEYLVKNKNQVCKRSDILQQIWGEDDYFMGRSLDVFISRCRKYIQSDASVKIENIHGVGFKLKVDD